MAPNFSRPHPGGPGLDFTGPGFPDPGRPVMWREHSDSIAERDSIIDSLKSDLEHQRLETAQLKEQLKKLLPLVDHVEDLTSNPTLGQVSYTSTLAQVHGLSSLITKHHRVTTKRLSNFQETLTSLGL